MGVCVLVWGVPLRSKHGVAASPRRAIAPPIASMLRPLLVRRMPLRAMRELRLYSSAADAADPVVRLVTGYWFHASPSRENNPLLLERWASRAALPRREQEVVTKMFGEEQDAGSVVYGMQRRSAVGWVAACVLTQFMTQHVEIGQNQREHANDLAVDISSNALSRALDSSGQWPLNCNGIPLYEAVYRSVPLHYRPFLLFPLLLGTREMVQTFEREYDHLESTTVDRDMLLMVVKRRVARSGTGSMSPGEIMEKIESGVEELCAQHEHSM